MKGRPVKDEHKPTVMRILAYGLFAHKFGWTPQEVDEIDLKTLSLLQVVVEQVGEVLTQQDGRRIGA